MQYAILHYGETHTVFDAADDAAAIDVFASEIRRSAKNFGEPVADVIQEYALIQFRKLDVSAVS